MSVPKYSAAGMTMSVDLFRATIDNLQLKQIPDADFIDGSVDLNLDRAIKLASSFTIRNPSQVTSYQDYLAPFLRLEYDDGSDPLYQQLGLYAVTVPPGTSTIEDEVATFAGADVTSVLAAAVFSDTYNISPLTNARGAIRTILGGAGIGPARLNMPATPRTVASAYRSYPAGSSRLAAVNNIAMGIGWYEAGTDLDGRVSTPGNTRPLTSVHPFRTLTDDDLRTPVQTLAPGRDPANVIVAVSEDENHAPLTSVARNDDPSSPTSTVQTGREMSPPNSPLKPQGPMTQADLDAYVAKELAVARSYYRVVQFSILPDPNALKAHQVVRLALTGANARFSGKWWVRTVAQGLTPSSALTVLNCNHITSDLTGASI